MLRAGTVFDAAALMHVRVCVLGLEAKGRARGSPRRRRSVAPNRRYRDEISRCAIPPKKGLQNGGESEEA